MQLEELSAARDADAERFASDVAALRDRVADVLKRMFSNEIGDEEAVEALRELGCEVRFVPAGRQGRRGSRQEARCGGGGRTLRWVLYYGTRRQPNAYELLPHTYRSP
jgi:hypothetical protein